MKIGFFSHHLERDGAPIILLQLASHYAEKGHICECISPKNGPLYTDTSEKIKVHIEPALANSGSIQNESIDTFLSQHPYNIYVINTLIQHHLIGRIRSMQPDAKIVWLIHESNPAYIQRALHQISEKDFAMVDSVIFTSNSTRKLYKQFDHGNMHTIYEGVDSDSIAHFCTQHTKESMRIRYGIPLGAQVVTHIGSMITRKGGEEMVQAAIDILTKNTDREIFFFFVGPEGSPFDTSRPIIESCIQNHNYQDRIFTIAPTKNVYDFLRMADVFLHYSYIEAFPRVILEAMAFSLPIVASNVFGIPEQIDSNKEGILISPGQHRLLAKTLRTVLFDKKLQKELGKNAHKRVQKDFRNSQWFHSVSQHLFNTKNTVQSAMQKRVAVIIPCHNYGNYVAETITSALKQTYPASRIIVIDDASTDNTPDVCTRFQGQGVEYMRGEWKNVSIARNEAAKYVEEDFLIFLDADDILSIDYIEQCLIAMEDPKTALAYGDWKWFGDIDRFDASPAFDLALELRTNYMSSHTMIRREAFVEAGGYRPDIAEQVACEDWDLYRRILLSGWKAMKANTHVQKRQHTVNRYDTHMALGYDTFADRSVFFAHPITIAGIVDNNQNIETYCKRVIFETDSLFEHRHLLLMQKSKQRAKIDTAILSGIDRLKIAPMEPHLFHSPVYKDQNVQEVHMLSEMIAQSSTEFLFYIPDNYTLSFSSMNTLCRAMKNDSVLIMTKNKEGQSLFDTMFLLHIHNVKESVFYTQIQHPNNKTLIEQIAEYGSVHTVNVSHV